MKYIVDFLARLCHDRDFCEAVQNDPDGEMDKFGLSADQKKAVKGGAKALEAAIIKEMSPCASADDSLAMTMTTNISL